jgi:dTMP kinase
MAGRFITLEGGEGTGKSTQAATLARRLGTFGIGVVLTREPGGSPGAEIVRHVVLSGAARPLGPVAEAMLFAAARRDHLENLIKPALSRGKWVVCDRFLDSTRVYQGILDEVGRPFVKGLEKLTVGDACPTSPSSRYSRRDRPCPARERRPAKPDRFEREDSAFTSGSMRRSATSPGRAAALRGDQCQSHQGPGRRRHLDAREEAAGAGVRAALGRGIAVSRAPDKGARGSSSERDKDADTDRDAPPPRETTVLFGHRAAEQEFLSSYRSGRIPHSWLITGEAGIGKATLAYRMARFVLANPDSAAAAVRSATSLALDPRTDGAAHRRQCPYRSPRAERVPGDPGRCAR